MPKARQRAVPDNGHDESGFVERVEHLNESAQQLYEDARSTLEDFGQAVDIRRRVRRHPYGMVAAALGAGYVLGGGLFSPFTFRLLGIGVRLAAIPVVKAQLLGLAEAAISGFTDQKNDVSSTS